MEQYMEFFGNHPFLFAALGMVMGMIFYTEFQRAAAAGTNLSVGDATRMQNDDDALFLDVRDNAAFKTGHLIDAKNIPIKSLAGKVSELSKYKDKPLIVYCDNGIQSGKACSTLKKEGFNKLYSLKGGIAAWEKENLPVVTK
ncbi:MAG: rhodanese-like domain-containing protein [Pseudomonadota bacterium]